MDILGQKDMTLLCRQGRRREKSTNVGEAIRDSSDLFAKLLPGYFFEFFLRLVVRPPGRNLGAPLVDRIAILPQRDDSAVLQNGDDHHRRWPNYIGVGPLVSLDREAI